MAQMPDSLKTANQFRLGLHTLPVIHRLAIKRKLKAALEEDELEGSLR